MASDSSYRDNDGALDWEEILTFDPKTRSAEQLVALKRAEVDVANERYAEYVEYMRDQFEGAPEDTDEFMEKFIDPKD